MLLLWLLEIGYTHSYTGRGWQQLYTAHERSQDQGYRAIFCVHSNNLIPDLMKELSHKAIPSMSLVLSATAIHSSHQAVMCLKRVIRNASFGNSLSLTVESFIIRAPLTPLLNMLNNLRDDAAVEVECSYRLTQQAPFDFYTGVKNIVLHRQLQYSQALPESLPQLQLLSNNYNNSPTFNANTIQHILEQYLTISHSKLCNYR